MKRLQPISFMAMKLVCAAGLIFSMQLQAEWLDLNDDGYHDPENPGIVVLQNPADALSALPKDDAHVGNNVRWVPALQQGLINPRTNIYESTVVNVLDMDIIMRNTGSSAYVLFPHKPHTEWLDCGNCHDEIFVKKAGGTKNVSMLAILNGQFCGRCHGAVAFPLLACERCHSIADKTAFDARVKEKRLYKHEIDAGFRGKY